VPKLSQDAYDAIIIGAGIGGLVCGCYLAKAGMKVLIAEQHHKPGGYCTSFKRKGFTFDAAAHCFGGYRDGGVTRGVFRYLEIDQSLKVHRSDPSNIVMTPDHEVAFMSDLNETIENFQSTFPHEKNNVAKFFDFLMNPDPRTFLNIRKWTFKEFMDRFFTDEKMKSVLAAPLLGLGGLPPSLMSAFVGSKLFSEFLLDGGYHPEGGMQTLADALSERFRELGGELVLSRRVTRIRVKKDRVIGITLEKDYFIPSHYVISNCDASQTFLKLLGRGVVREDFLHTMKKMLPSISNFVLYLGLDGYTESIPAPGTTFCFFPHYDLLSAYKAALKGDIERYGGFMFYVNREMPTILAIIPAPFKNETFWKEHRNNFSEVFVDRIENNCIPFLKSHIAHIETATPITLHRYTLNYKGASFGWAGTPEQLAIADFRKPSFLNGLYLSGHWTTQALGISGVVYVGADIAKMILKQKKFTGNMTESSL
jgi:phytoene dehydrogenase-like protein